MDGKSGLFEHLISLEREMHKGEVRRDRNRMNALLHPNFVEFSRSGIRYSRTEILEELSSESAFPAIHSEHFQMADLAEGVALVTYVSAHLDADGNPHRYSLRSSIWVLTGAGWQIRFHQGTPASGGVPGR